MTRLLPLLLACMACRDAAPPTPASGPVAPTSSASQRTLDVDATGRRLTGRLRPAPTDADPLPLLDTSLEGRALPLGDVVDARFVPGRADRFVVVDGQGVLAIRDASGAELRRLDVDADAGLSVNAACACVAYMSGPPYERAVKVAPLEAGDARTVAADVSPAWLPVLSPDGSFVAFVSGRTGFPAIWTVQADGSGLTQRTNVGAGSVDALTPTPEGPEVPTWDGRTLRFLSTGGTYEVPLDAGKPLPVRPGEIRGTP